MSAHTPGALRAAKEIVEATQELMPDTILRTASMIDKTAALIDRETGALELLEALKALLSAFDATGKRLYSISGRPTSRDLAVAAIAKVEGKQ